MSGACVQGGLCILGVWAVCRLLPRIPVHVRCVLWWLACLKLLVGLFRPAPIPVPILRTAAPFLTEARGEARVGAAESGLARSLPEFDPGFVKARAVDGARSRSGVGRGALAAQVDEATVGTDHAVAVAPWWPALLLGGWVVGLSVQGGFLLRQYVAVRRLVRGATPLNDPVIVEVASRVAASLGLRRPPRILVSEEVVSPVLLGLIRPAVLLSRADLDRLSERQITMVLAHELAHLRRGDLWLGCVPAAVRGLFFFHPLAWPACREFGLCREAACDLDALRVSGEPADAYGQLLLTYVCVGHRAQALGGLGAASGYRPLQRRLNMLEHNRPISARRIRATLALALAVGVVCLIPWRLVAAPQSRGHAALSSSLSGASGGPGRALLLAARETGADRRETMNPSVGEVVGRVVTPDGKPVSNASVAWIERNGDEDLQSRFMVTTDALGQFRFPEALPVAGTDRFVTFAAFAAGWGIGYVTPRHGGAGSAALTLTLPLSASARVAFTDVAGRPLPGLAVRVSSLYDPASDFLGIPAALHGRWEQKTDAKGECVFAGLPEGVHARLAVADAAYATPGYDDEVFPSRLATQEARPVRLLPSATVQGRVTWAADGQPVGGIRVGAQSARGWAEAFTDASGNYRLTQLRPGVYNVALFLKGEWEHKATARAIELLDVKQGAVLKGQDFVLIPGAVVTGTVTEAGSGRPVAGAMVGIYGPAHPRSGAAVQLATTGPDGVYTARVPAGAQYVYVQTPRGYERSEASVDLTVADGATRSADFTLTPAPTPEFKPIHGHVVGPDGSPIAGATVTAFPNDRDPARPAVSRMDIRSDATGSFSFPEPVSEADLGAHSGVLATEKIVSARGGDDVVLTLKPNTRVTLSGQVRNEHGVPVSDARVTLFLWRSEMGSSDVVVRTDAQGRFTFRDLYPDFQYSVSATVQGYGQQSTYHVAYRPGGTVALPPLTLPRADRVVSGKVVDDRGGPVARQGVVLEGGGTGIQVGYTDATGRFRFQAVVDEPLIIELQHLNRTDVWQPKHIHAGDSGVVLVRSGSGQRSGSQ
jgi:beta-lactamase regulating signal transducer with metallopeptidase domain/protocatechuate 3,4-dioxygenase beta subunit